MAKGGNKLLIGCGIGCGLILLIGALLVGGGALWVRDLAQEFGNAVELRAELDGLYGAPSDWTPPAAGSIPPQRVEAFLAMRDGTRDARARIAETISVFAISEQRLESMQDAGWRTQLGEVMRITRTTFDLPGALGEYFRARNRALLDAEMGYGEYAYLYAIGYWSLLGIDPADGPQQVSFDDGPDGDVVTIRVDETGSSVAVQPEIMSRVRDELLAMLRNQLAACDASASCPVPWHDALAAELDAMLDDPRRLPWPDGPPQPLASSLEPFRERLRASYNQATNPFELARNRQRGSWSIQSE